MLLVDSGGGRLPLAGDRIGVGSLDWLAAFPSKEGGELTHLRPLASSHEPFEMRHRPRQRDPEPPDE